MTVPREVSAAGLRFLVRVLVNIGVARGVRNQNRINTTNKPPRVRSEYSVDREFEFTRWAAGPSRRSGSVGCRNPVR